MTKMQSIAVRLYTLCWNPAQEVVGRWEFLRYCQRANEALRIQRSSVCPDFFEPLDFPFRRTRGKGALQSEFGPVIGPGSGPWGARRMYPHGERLSPRALAQKATTSGARTAEFEIHSIAL